MRPLIHHRPQTLLILIVLSGSALALFLVVIQHRKRIQPPYGLQALWPFSSAWLISGWDLFRQTERRRMLSAASMRINLAAVAQELAILVPVVTVVWLVRVKALARLATELSRGDHPPQ